MRIFTVLFALAVLVAPNMALAASKVAVVDLRSVLTNSDAGKSITSQRDAIQSSFLDDIQKTEKALRDEEQALVKERESLSSEAFLKKKQVYERKLLETGRSAREEKQALEAMFTQSINTLRAKLTEIVAAIASEQGYDLVVTKQNVIIASKSIDITADAMARLNEQLPRIDMKQP